MTATWLKCSARLSPDAPALVCAEGTWTWAELAARAHSLARRLRSLGVAPGDSVAALLGNAPRFVELLHAGALCGATLVPLHAAHTSRELARSVADAQARWLLHPGSDVGERAAAAAREVGDVTLLSPEQLVAAEESRGALHPRVDLDVPLAVLHTSGTSGVPKGAVLTHGNFLWNAVASATHLGAVPGDRWLACMPLCHVGGLTILTRSVLFRAAVVLHDRFDPQRASDALDEEGITLVSFVPTMLRRVLDARGDAPPPPALRAVLLGGGPLPWNLIEEAWERGWPVLPTYGLTEACSQVATLPIEEIGRRSEVAGRPLLGLSVEIRDPDGAPLPPGQPGEIAVHGPSVMAGYRGRPDATARALRKGWLHTGDVGVLDAEGWLRALERRDDLVVSGGENVYPAEVEAVLAAHPAVREAGVAAESDPDLGQRVAAWVVPVEGAAVRPDELRAFCRARLAGYKVPRAIRVVDALPRSDSGKLRRDALRALATSSPATT